MLITQENGQSWLQATSAAAVIDVDCNNLAYLLKIERCVLCRRITHLKSTDWEAHRHTGQKAVTLNANKSNKLQITTIVQNAFSVDRYNMNELNALKRSDYEVSFAIAGMHHQPICLICNHRTEEHKASFRKSSCTTNCRMPLNWKWKETLEPLSQLVHVNKISITAEETDLRYGKRFTSPPSPSSQKYVMPQHHSIVLWWWVLLCANILCVPLAGNRWIGSLKAISFVYSRMDWQMMFRAGENHGEAKRS